MIHLSNRQLQTLVLVSYGLSNKGAAERMGISEACVKRYLQDVSEKLDASNRTDVVAKAFRMGILH